MHTFKSFGKAVPKTRWQAASIHLGLCAVLYVVLLYLILFYWYPQPYFAADGGWEGIRLITGVDLVLGPALTLIVYKLGKPGLRRDLALIGILQTVAIIWGTWLVYEQRTAMVTYADGSFFTLNYEQVQSAGGKAIDVAERSETIPPYAFVRLPAEARARQKLRLQALSKGLPVHQLGDYYEPLGKSNYQAVLAQGLDMNKYTAKSEDNRQIVGRFLARHGGTEKDYAFLILSARYQEPLLALRRTDGQVIDTLNINRRASVINPPATTSSATK